MEKKDIPVPVILGAIAVLIVLVGFFIFKSATGGTVGAGKPGTIQAAPPGQGPPGQTKS